MATSSVATSIPPSLRTLLESIVDYAGLFPPAGLPLSEAFPNYLSYRMGPHAWMLNHFIIPVGRLDDLTPYAGDVSPEDPVTLSVLGTGGDDSATFVEGFESTLGAIDTLHTTQDGRFSVEVVEVRLPTAFASHDEANLAEAMDQLLILLGEKLQKADLSTLDLFLEVPLEQPTSFFDGVALALTRFNQRQGLQHGLRVGFKMRTGSTEPDEVPNPHDVARALTACHRAKVHFKATAGLHHPMRHYNEELGGPMHGFLNVFGAAALTAAHDLSADAVTTLLQAEDVEQLLFADDGLIWDDLQVPIDVLRTVRAERAFSFGSCSFDEPREDLRAIGLLP